MERGMAARRCARTRYLALACVKAEKMSEEKVKEWSARQKFARFLEEHKKRKTPERFVILEKIFSSQAHVGAEALYNLLLADGYRVNRATVYNTLDLLVEAGLVRRVTLGDGMTRYERVSGSINHHHLICTRCGKVKEVKAVNTVAELLPKKPRSFEPAYYTLYIYGMCSSCARREQMMRAGTTEKSR